MWNTLLAIIIGSIFGSFSVLIVVYFVFINDKTFKWINKKHKARYTMDLVARIDYDRHKEHQILKTTLDNFKKYIDSMYGGWLLVYKDRDLHTYKDLSVVPHDTFLHLLHEHVPLVFKNREYKLTITAVDVNEDVCRIVEISVYSRYDDEIISTITMDDTSSELVR